MQVDATNMNSGWNNGQASMFQPGAGHLNYSHLDGFDVNAFPNGNATPQPGQQFANPSQTFTPQSTIPAKRPHDDASRSQTPSSYANFPGQQQFPNAPTPYQHLQQPGSNNNTPSPTMQNQQFRPPPQQQQQQPRMNNASPSPFPGQQQSGNFGNPGTPQNQGMAQMGQMGMNIGAMNMPNQMQQQMANMNNMQANNASRAYQMKLLQHQQQLRASGMLPPRAMGGQPGQMAAMGGMQGMPAAGQMPNGQMNQQMMQAQAQQQAKRAQFLKTLAMYHQQMGKQFNQTPVVAGRPVDLFALWTIVTSAGGSPQVEKGGQWPTVAAKMSFPPTVAEELKNVHTTAIAGYERIWFQQKMQQKQQEARIHAQQMAFNGQPQQSPTKMMQPPGQQNQFQQLQQNQQVQQGTPVQANASLPPNGMSTTPQQMMGSAAGMHHRRNSSLRKPEQMTPQPGVRPDTASASPLVTKQRPPSVKQESTGAVMKSEEPQSTNYQPQVRSIETDGGYDIPALYELGSAIAAKIPNMPTVDEMGVIDTKAITLSLASGIHAEVRYALDVLAIISFDQRVALNLNSCEDLLDVIVDCAEEQIEILSEDAAEVSDALDLPSYEDVLRSAKLEAETLQEVPEFGTRAYDLDRAADKLIAITTTLRNFSFYEFNHSLLTSAPLIKWLSNTIRLLGTRNMLLRSHLNTGDYFKDTIIFLSNITQSLELPTRDDALHILHFLLAFAPQPAPSYVESGGKLRFTSFSPIQHKYLPPAVDCLAKLLARQDPNRTLYKSIFAESYAITESPLDLLTKAFALSISVLPDRSKGPVGNTAQLRIVEARKAYLTQGMLAADILTTLAPSSDADLARAWIESEDGWAVALLNLAALLSVDRNQAAGPKGRELGMDTETFKLITYRALTMMKRLAEKAGKGSVRNVLAQTNGISNGEANGTSGDDDEPDLPLGPKWEGIPQGHAILGALMMPNTDKVALGLLCGLHEMAMSQS
ncbi:hypothetical protein CB0940_05590 [Cercospora beticola]|uniref:ARID domain-containing protein n=1 Tax=Cercospora beticola TaxID=122368 RepID=A0A2G5HWX3_CERBT|nr:hypothetical protein CB0940_05590 [Cercospora beticola]PIA97064.1 hypothetical protein CB0940_05590 [Cercospora beticola]WPA98153.1 hypothetical protein RHO25_002764 [Cercospora beticola]